MLKNGGQTVTKTKVFPNDEDADRKLNNEISLIADMAPTYRQADSSFTGGLSLYILKDELSV